MYYLPTWKTLCRTGLKVFLHFNASMVCPSSPLSDKEIYIITLLRERNNRYNKESPTTVHLLDPLR